MNRRTSSVLAFSSTIAVAMLAASAMVGTARADDITIDNTPFVSTKTRAEVKAELFASKVSSAGGEYALQQNGQHIASDYTREQARADYIASRDQVRAMNAEDSGSSALAQGRAKSSGVMVAKDSR
ncbi:hypothetical protein GCM10027034_13920 [Ramlibacter solisilvae]|nr:DUF4148 domain-containing protein [Ramlibacter tataouinensis]